MECSHPLKKYTLTQALTTHNCRLWRSQPAATLVVDSDGEVIVPMYDWASFFAPLFKKLPVTHHFQLCSSKPGVVISKKHSDSDEKEHKILKGGVEIDMPPVIEPQGLSKFCPVADQDVTCPEPSSPSSPRPTNSRYQPPAPNTPTSPSPPAKTNVVTLATTKGAVLWGLVPAEHSHKLVLLRATK